MTETAPLKVFNDELKATDSDQFTLLMLPDLKSVVVDHNTMIARLRDVYGSSGSVLDGFVSYLTGRCLIIALGSLTYKMEKTSCGVPHGSVLGPIHCIYHFSLETNQFSQISYNLYAKNIQLYCSFPETDLTNLLDCLIVVCYLIAIYSSMFKRQRQ